MTAVEIENRIVFADTVPKPLPKALKDVPALDPVVISSRLRPWITDIAERMQCPIEFAAVTALMAAGSVVGNGVVVKPKVRDPWIVASNIWVGRSLSAKREETFESSVIFFGFKINL